MLASKAMGDICGRDAKGWSAHQVFFMLSSSMGHEHEQRLQLLSPRAHTHAQVASQPRLLAAVPSPVIYKPPLLGGPIGPSSVPTGPTPTTCPTPICGGEDFMKNFSSFAMMCFPYVYLRRELK
ncbi:Protein of unknown function [Gryllus bimaculatus]|nr:Protein of unknown function [Gryllus bimaculatus]